MRVIHSNEDGGFYSYVVTTPICDYLAAAAKTCAPMNEKVWLDKQKDLLKQNDYQSVLGELESFLEADTIEAHNAPVRACPTGI